VTIRAADGFTLLEILVALVVLGFLMLGLAQGTRFGVDAWQRQARTLAERGDLDAVDRALRRLIEQADPGEGTKPPHFIGAPARLEFATELPLAASTLPSRRANVALAVDPANRLVLRWVPIAQAARRDLPPQENELLQGVDHLDLSYLRPVSNGGGWFDKWTGPTLPELVRIRIVFLKGDRRHWPDIVAAPMREQP
jgi:general secretion pathway protein J